jgi:MFS-type transporter involved in bile tolerance (Atg22 family)
MVYLWISSSFCIYLVGYNIKNLPGDFFMVNLISFVSEIPVAIFAGILYHKFGLKPVLIGFFCFATLGGIGVVLLGEGHEELMPFMVALAKGGVKATFDVCYLANSFIFPAIFAGTAFGFCNAGAKIATILSPILAEEKPPVPMIVFSIATGLASIAPIFIKTVPE